MNPNVTKLPGIPRPPADASPALRSYLEALSEAIEIRLGRRGDPVDRAVTLRELINSGLAIELRANPFDPNNPSDNPGFVDSTKAVVTTIPLQPTGFSVAGAYSVINLVWDFPNYSDHNQTEIWAHSADVIGDATLTGVGIGRTYIDSVGSGVTRYYWIRHVNTAGVYGPWNSATGTVGQTSTDVEFQLDVLTNAISSSELADTLRTELDTFQDVTDVNGLITVRGYQTLANVNNAIDANSNGFQTVTDVNGNITGRGYQTSSDVNSTVGTAVAGVRGKILTWATSGEYAVNEVVRDNAGNLYVCISAVSAGTNDALPTSFASPTTHWKLYGDMASTEDSASKITQINLIDSNSTSAAAQAILGINSVLFDGNGNAVVSATNLSTMKTSLLNENGTARASATQVDFLNANYINPQTGAANITLQQSLNTTASNVTGLRGQYSVKIDANGHVAGFGLSSTSVAAGTATSEFFVNANKFAILPDQATTVTQNWLSGTTYFIGNKVKYNNKLYQARVAHSNVNPTASNSATYWDSLSIAPFTVTTNGSTVNGTYVPAGVYINSAMIKHASITSAQIGSVNADTIDTGTLNVTDRITAGSIDAQKLVIGGSVITSEPRPSDGKHFLKIAATSITTALIDDAAIGTLQVAGNAITVQDAAIQTSNITLGVVNSSSWTTIVTDTFDPVGGGFVATFTGQLTITDDSRADFRLTVNGNVQRSWNTGMRADNGTSVEGEMSSVMAFAQSSTTSGGVTVAIQGKYFSGLSSVMSNGCLTIDGSKR